MRAPTCRSHGLAHVLDWAVLRGARREKLLAQIALEPARARSPTRCPKRGLLIAEASDLVGFAEPSVFHRASKRWTGETAASYRARSREKQR